LGIVILLVVLIPDRLWTSFNRAHLLGVTILLTVLGHRRQSPLFQGPHGKHL